MKLKLSETKELLNSLEILEDCILPPKVSYAISYNESKLSEQVKLYDSEHDKLILRYAIKDERGNPIGEDLGDGQTKYSIEEPVKFSQETDDLDSTEVEIDIRMIPQEQIERAAEDDRYSALSIKQYEALSFMLED